jgi:choline dehydrogenase-like flavoprotein
MRVPFPGPGPSAALLPMESRGRRQGVLDAIVVGSGMGGLTAAAALAKRGRRVLVLEQHSQLGGLTQTFSRGEYTFATGVHYIGGMGDEPGQDRQIRGLLQWLTGGRLRFAAIGSPYDIVRVGEQRARASARGIRGDQGVDRRKAPRPVQTALPAARAPDRLPRVLDAALAGRVRRRGPRRHVRNRDVGRAAPEPRAPGAHAGPRTAAGGTGRGEPGRPGRADGRVHGGGGRRAAPLDRDEAMT